MASFLDAIATPLAELLRVAADYLEDPESFDEEDDDGAAHEEKPHPVGIINDRGQLVPWDKV